MLLQLSRGGTSPPYITSGGQAVTNERSASADQMPTYRVYAVKYAERDARRGEHFLGGDPHDAPMSNRS